MQLEKPLETSLRDKVLHLLRTRNDSISFSQIQRDTGIKTAWLNKFSQGLIESPGVNIIQTLYNHLNNKKLEV